jgi:hypothetical protein
MSKEAKEGKSFAEVSKEISSETAQRTAPTVQQVYQQPVVYQGPSRTQQGYAQAPYQQSGYQQNPAWQKNYRCPGCGIPVKEDWVQCTNCGTDLRQYPPIPY